MIDTNVEKHYKINQILKENLEKLLFSIRSCNQPLPFAPSFIEALAVIHNEIKSLQEHKVEIKN